MDFNGLLYAAQKNDVSKGKNSGRFYKTTFSPPKKEEKTRGLSINVKKFLARKEEEEKLRKIEEEKKREALLQLRNQDNKAKKRVQVMLKRTKSYNKSVLVDAIDEVNTADTMNGPQQCDEDDYGYVSQEASAFYSKMMDKYGSVPSEDKSNKKNKHSSSNDLLSTKDRVKQALQRQEEEEMGPHKRKRRKKDDDTKDEAEPEEDSRHSSERNHREKEKEREEKPKPKRPLAPPPMDFTALLKIAEKKQYEPPPLELKLKEAKRAPPKEPERLMTKKEKLEYERNRDKRLQKDSGSSSDARRPESKPDRKEKEKDDERKKKEQRAREEERNKRQQVEREQERRRQDDREQERRRQDDREQERRRQDDREQERRRQDDREQEKRRQDEREKERRRQEDREHERRREEDRERQRERERIRELEEELARRKEMERMREERERREKERKYASIPKKADSKPASRPSSTSVSKPKEIPVKAPSKSVKPNTDRPTSSRDNRNGDIKKKTANGEKMNDLFGDRDSASPERGSKTEKSKQPAPRPVERIKVSNTSTNLDDLFGDAVTIRMKQKPVPNGSVKIPVKTNDKGSKPPPAGSSRPGDPKKDKNPADRKRPLETNGRNMPDKRPKPDSGKVPSQPKDFPPKDLKSRQFPPADVRSRQFPPADVKSRQFPPADVRSRQFPPPDVRGRQFPPSDVARNSAANRRFDYERGDSGDSSDEEEEEYDSELDDFIDDGPEEGEDYSKYIRDIFGYDKSRYANIEDEDECMESNFAQVMCEEKRSARIGLMEDIEDMKKEQMEKRLKALRKMKGKR